MDTPADFLIGKSPRKDFQLQGPRPTPLKIHKDSHKIRKPSVPAPAPAPRPPVIIYTVSPKVIHTNPGDFMTLVQRLTGFGSSSTCNIDAGAGSPAARYATIEKTKVKKQQNDDMGIVEGIEMPGGVERISLFPGILSPAALPAVPANFFSPQPPEQNSISLFHDLSPVLHGNRNYIEGSFMPSPSSFASPTPSLDLFNNFLDF